MAEAVLIYKGAKADYWRKADGTFNTAPDVAGGYARLTSLMQLKGETRAAEDAALGMLQLAPPIERKGFPG